MISNIIKRIIKILSSVKLALFIMIGLTIASILGVTKLEGVFSSWWFLALVIIFFLNTLTCTIQQVRRTLSKVKGLKNGNWNSSKRINKELRINEKEFQGDIGEIIQKAFQKKKYKTKEFVKEESILFLNIKNKLAYWGSVIFHISLLIVIVGGVLTLTMKMWGSFGVLEKKFFNDRHEDYVMTNEGPWTDHDFSRFKLYLNRVILDITDEGELHDYKADITFFEDGQPVKRALVSGPSPVEYKGLIFYKKLFGYAPGLILKQDGEEKVRFFTTIDTKLDKSQNIYYKQEFKIPRSNLKVEADFYPTITISDGKPEIKSHTLERPAMYLKVFEGDKLLYDGVLFKDKTVNFANYSLHFAKLKRWYGFSVVRDYGISIVFFGFGLSVIGLIFIYLIIPKEIGCLLSKEDDDLILEFSGRTSRFKSLFAEEFDSLMEEFESELTEEEGEK